MGWKWSVASEEGHGIPVGWAIDGANGSDIRMLQLTLDVVVAAGLLADIDTLHLDRGYDYRWCASASPVRAWMISTSIGAAPRSRARRCRLAEPPSTGAHLVKRAESRLSTVLVGAARS